MPLPPLGLYAHMVACADPFHRGRLRYHQSAALRELNNQLSLLNHRVSAHIDLNDTDLDCLELINRHGPLNPSALARHAGLHPATITGILDRLERGGWVARERDPSDRRAVVIRPLRDRNAELFPLYAGMNTAMDQLCVSYGDEELQLLADFPPPHHQRRTNRHRPAGQRRTGQRLRQQPRPVPHRRGSDAHRVTPSWRFAVKSCVDPAAVLLETAPRGHQPR